ncbi:hypothetical protein [uncultured Clostridium sp.]|nr:hypothetical protein [uncultured Clostridium sp.]
MNGNVELLNYIHQNSEMGQDTIKQLVDINIVEMISLSRKYLHSN